MISFDELIKEAAWAFKYRLPKGYKWEVEKIEENFLISLSDEFKQTFPRYTHLIELADVKQFVVNGNIYRFYQWNGQNEEPIVWLCDLGTHDSENTSKSAGESSVTRDELLVEHILLLDNVGGILEMWDEIEDEDVLTWAKNFVFSFSSCYRISNHNLIYGEDGWIFDEVDDNDKLPIDEMVCFSEEANGNLTFYNQKTKDVFLLLGDHCFNYVEEVAGHPEYSFYTLQEAKTFVDYAELLAKQILDNIKQ